VTSALVAILGVCVLVATDDPTTSPDVSYIIRIILVLSMTLNFTVRIMMPKLKMIWNGQTVLVSKLVADHKQSLIDSTRVTDRRSVLHNVTGFADPSNSVDPNTSFQHSYSRDNSRDNGSCVISEGASERNYNPSLTGGNMNIDKKEPVLSTATKDIKKEDMENSIAAQDVWTKAINTDVDGHVEFNPEHDTTTDNEATNNKRAKKHLAKLIVKEHEAPSRKLTVRMLDLQYELNGVTNRIMSGLEVNRSDWETVRVRTEELEELFSLVKFGWEGNSSNLADTEEQEEDSK
jgi:hypothetical protein